MADVFYPNRQYLYLSRGLTYNHEIWFTVDIHLLKKAKSPNAKPEVKLHRNGRHFEKMI